MILDVRINGPELLYICIAVWGQARATIYNLATS